MEMPGMSLLAWKKNMEPRKRVLKRFLMFNGLMAFIVRVVDAKKPAILPPGKRTGALNVSTMFP
jgi:hypothetical protein